MRSDIDSLWTRGSASLPCVLIFGLAVFGQVLAADFIQESARKIPLVKETDVLVVGGSSGAVSAALAAKAAGADVYLVAPRPYLGEDIAGTLRLGLEDGEPTRPLSRRTRTRTARSSPTVGPTTWSTVRCSTTCRR